MEDNRDMNLWDLCVKAAQGIEKLLMACIRLLQEILRIAYRQWWVVTAVMLIAVVCALYYTREDNLRYRVNAIVYLNGPTTQEVENTYTALNNGHTKNVYKRQNLQETLSLTNEEARQILSFSVYHIIDNLNDGTADYIDWYGFNNGSDTLHVLMHDRLVLQFVCRNLGVVENTEKGIIEYLNNQQQFIDAYSVYKADKERQLFFDQLQIEKLDTLTTRLYAQAGQMQIESNALNLTLGKQQIDLPLDDIESFFDRKLLRDCRFMYCTAPVTLQGHFFVADCGFGCGFVPWLCERELQTVRFFPERINFLIPQ